jgi:hypothetical protein
MVLAALVAVALVAPALGAPAPDGSVPWPTVTGWPASGWSECPDGCVCTEAQICCVLEVCDEWGWGVDENCYDRCFFWCGSVVCTLSCALVGAGCSSVATPLACAILGSVCDLGCDFACDRYCTDRCWGRICTDWDWVFKCAPLPPFEPYAELKAH